MEYREFTAKTVEEAITQACVEFGLTSDRLEYDVVQEPSSGFLGIGSKNAVIRARARSEEELAREQDSIRKAEEADAAMMSGVMQMPEKKAAATEADKKPVLTMDEIEKRAAAAAARAKDNPEEASESTERRERRSGDRDRRGRGRRDDRRRGRSDDRFREVEERPHKPSQPKPERQISPKTEEEAAAIRKAGVDFLTEVFARMGMEVEIESSYDQEEGCLNCVFSGEEMGILIGKRGQTLDSLQYLTSLVVNRGQEEYIRVKLDTEDYRARRAQTLQNLARNIAYKVKRNRRAVALEPMNPYERRIIHSALQSNNFVETYSEGEEPYRHVVVAPKR